MMTGSWRHRRTRSTGYRVAANFRGMGRGKPRRLWKLRKSPFTKPGPVKRLFEYHRPGFHPNDRETGELISIWRENLFGSEGTLVELLAS